MFNWSWLKALAAMSSVIKEALPERGLIRAKSGVYVAPKGAAPGHQAESTAEESNGCLVFCKSSMVPVFEGLYLYSEKTITIKIIQGGPRIQL